MSSSNNPLVSHQDCFSCNKRYSNHLSKYGFLVDSKFFDNHMLLEQLSTVFVSLSSKINDGIFILDDQLRFVCVNEQFLKITRLPRDKILGSPFYYYEFDNYPPHLQQTIEAIRTQLNNHQSVSTNLVLSFGNLPEVATWLDISVCQVDEKRVVFAGLLINLTQKASKRLSTLSKFNYDELTGLPNYDTFYERLKACIKHYYAGEDNHDYLGVLLRINIDKLQSFNLSLGIENTNTLIQGFVKRVQSLKVPGTKLDSFSRFGGDSFAAMIAVDDIDCAHQYLDSLKQLFELPFTINNQSIYLRLSVGISVYPTHSNNAQTLLLQADTALKHARLLSDDDFVWYQANQQQNLFKNIHLLSAFKSALSKQQIICYFQPKLCFKQPNKPMFEALVRWEHPTLGLLYPKDFLNEVLDKSSQPLFEKTILACIDQALAWRNLGYHCLICVNIDSRQLISEKFTQFIEAMLQQFPSLPELISFEITELSKIYDESKAQTMLSILHDSGFSISIDDFGTGFSTMQYLIKYPINILKIDRIFITDILTDAKKQVIVKSIIDLAHALSMQALAEGVSSANEIDYLRHIGCDCIQGFGYSEPMSSEDTTHWLKANFKPNYLL